MSTSTGALLEAILVRLRGRRAMNERLVFEREENNNRARGRIVAYSVAIDDVLACAKEAGIELSEEVTRG